MLVPVLGGVRRHFTAIRANYVKILTLAVINTFLHYGLFYISIYHLPGALVAIIIGSSPLITALIVILFIKSEHVGFPKFMAIVVGLAGIIYISLQRHTLLESGELDLLYIVLLVGAVTCGVMGTVTVAKFKERVAISPVVLTSLQIFIGGAMLLIVSLFVEGAASLAGKSLRFYGALAWLAFLSAAGFSIWFTVLKRPGVSVTDMNRWKFIIPLFGSTLSWLLVDGESPSIHSIAGMAVVLLSVMYYEYLIRRDVKQQKLS